jgi:carboxyl-terminal processing protease
MTPQNHPDNRPQNNSGLTSKYAQHPLFKTPIFKNTLLALIASAALTACGGGGGDVTVVNAPAPAPVPAPPAALTCSFPDQKQWLRDYMQQSYLWYRNAPNPAPDAFTSVSQYLDALTWQPTDRFSFDLTEAEYQATFVNGRDFGYGAAFVQEGGAGGAVRITYVEPASPAEAAGLRRGDTVVRINGAALTSPLDAASVALVSANLFPSNAGLSITIGVRANGTGAERVVAITSADVTTSPVLLANVVTATDGRKVGYVVFNSFVQTATPQLRSVFAQLRSAGVSDLVLDLRYNGGGLIDISSELASMVIGARAAGQPYITYSHNDKLAPTFNRTSRMPATDVSTQLNLNRLFVLSTARTASASELIINATKPYLDVVQIGQTSFGKPVGQYPTTNCAQTYFAVNFETLNSQGVGGYYNGIAPKCTVVDNLNLPLGDVNEPMLSAALSYRQSGTCPAGTAAAKQAAQPNTHLGPRGVFGTMIGVRESNN